MDMIFGEDMSAHYRVVERALDWLFLASHPNCTIHLSDDLE